MLLFEHVEESNVREMRKIDDFGLSPMHSAYGFLVGEVLSPCKLPISRCLESLKHSSSLVTSDNA